MNSHIISGKIWHSRSLPKSHSFTYPALSFAIDLDEVASLKRFYPLFGVNRCGIYSFHEHDYLGGGTESLKSRLIEKTKAQLAIPPDSKIILITMPKFFGYVFNPVNFYFILDSNCRVDALVCEVQNTFGESHLYCSRLLSRAQDGRSTFGFPKEFYVSPFLEVEGDYEISVAPYHNSLDLHLSLTQKGRVRFAARFWGKGSPFSTPALLWSVATRPLVSTLAMLRIHCQAFVLYFLRSAEIAPKPSACHHNTFRSNPNWLHRARLWVLSIPARLRRAEGK